LEHGNEPSGSIKGGEFLEELKTEAASKVLRNFCTVHVTTRRHDPENRYLNLHHSENLKSHMSDYQLVKRDSAPWS